MDELHGLVRSVAAMLLVLGLAAGVGACTDTGPYAKAKHDWDATPSDDTRQDMRTRLATTQQDH